MNSRLARTVLTVLAISVAGVGLAACTQHGRGGDRHYGWHDRYDRHDRHDHRRDRDRDRDRRGWEWRR